MADIADTAQDAEEAIQAARDRLREPYTLPPGTPGDCQYCGDSSPRLIGGACAQCREKRRLP